MKENKIQKQEIVLLLEDIRSVHNVGSIFRTAETAGVSRIYCIGTTPVPVDRFGRKRKDFAKVSLGAEDMLAWEHVDQNDIYECVARLKNEKFQIIAIEQAKDSCDYRDVKAKDKAALILGNEVDGISQDLIAMADIIAEIPMKGKKESLNVSVAAGVALFGIFD